MIDGVAQVGALISHAPAMLVHSQRSLATLALHLPFALDGEAEAEAGGNSTAIAIVSAVSIVFGYLLLAALWHFVFREKARAKRRKGSLSDRD
ncbi:MAG TPA: hypothetical protein VGL68_08425 [Solirubrobacteraceae bacterium]|jgi:hypothetical protein